MTATIIDIDTPNEPKLYQWDTGRTISIDDDCTYVDYVVSGFPGCMRVEVTNRTAQIPNAALTRHGILTIMLVKDNDDGHRTIAKQTEIIEKRAKPDDYIFTDGDYMNWEWIKEHAIEATQEAEETALENIAAAKSAAVAAVNSAATAISTSAESALESAEAASGSAEDAASSAEDAEGYADQARQYAEAAAGTPYNGIVTNWTKLPDALYSKNVNGESSGYKIANSGYNAGFNPGELPYVLKGATVTIDTSGGWTDYDFSPQGAMFTSKGAEVGTYINGSRVNYAAGVRTYTAPCDGYIFVAFRSMTKVNGSYVTLTADDRREILKHVAISGKTIVPDVNYSDVQALKDDTMYTEKSDIGDYSWLIAAEQHESEARHDAPLPNESAMLSNAVAALNSADPQHSMFRISYITDTHIDTEIDNRRQGWMPSVRVFRNLTGYTDIAVHGGDLIQGTKNGHEQAIRNMIAGYRAFDGTNLYITRGNHDCNARTTEGISQKLWGKYFSGVFKSDGFHTRDPECCYGYIDYPDKKIRCAFLNVHELDARSRELNRVSTTQLKYLFGAPDSKTRNASYFGQYAGGATGWTYICFCHTPGHMNQTQLVNKAVAKYIVSQGVKVVFIHGDSHKDMIEYIPYTVNGTTYYGLNLGVDRAFYTNFGDKTTTYTPEYGTEGMYCVDTLAIDTANNTLHEVRAGRRYMAEDLQDDGAELGTVSDGKIKCYKLYDYITQSSGSTGSAASTPFWDNDLLDPGESAPEEEEDAVVEAPEELPEGIPENGYMRYNKHAKILFWVTPAEGQTLQAAYYGHTPRGYFPKETAADLDDRLDAIEGGGDIAYRQDLVNYQPKLSSGENIKTLNNQSILGSGNISISGGAEKEWVLKGTVAGNADDRGNIDSGLDGDDFDLIGCTELIIQGTITATGNGNLYIDGSQPICNTFYASGTRNVKCVYKDVNNSFMPVCGFFGASVYIASVLTICGHTSRKISDITTIFFSHPDRVTSCDIKIYAR